MNCPTNKKILSVLLAASLILSVIQMPYAHATPIFGTALNLTTKDPDDDTDPSTSPNIAASGNNVYAVWQKNGGNVLISISTNNGSTFSTGTRVSDPNGAITSGVGNTPKVAIGNHVYVIWANTTGTDIYFAKNTTNSGSAFTNPPSNLTPGNGLTGTAPKIAASGNNVYVVWQNATRVDYRASSNGGTSFSDVTTLGTGTDPQIAVGTDGYIVWRDSGKIRFAVVSSAGGTPSTSIILSNTTGNSIPQIAASGTTAYAVWKDTTPSGSNGDILFSKISNGVISINGTNLSSNSGTSDRPQVAVDASDVYVTWDDDTSLNREVLFKRSTDSGANFGSQVNLSNTSSSSTSPSIAVSGDNVNVVWKDSVLGNSANTILFKSSSDKGATFGGLKNLASSAQRPADFPQVVAAGTKAYTTWTKTNTPSAFVISGASSAKNIKFDLSQYAIDATATITVTNSTTSNSVDTNIQSTTDATGVTLRLSETGTGTGVFTGTISLTSAASSGGTCSSGCHLQVASGDTLTSTYLGQTANAFMPTRTLSFAFASYTLSAGRVHPTATTLPSAIITLTDTTANTDATTFQAVDITVTSTSQTSGITLRLNETGVNTGIFKNSKLIFTTGTGQHSVGDTLAVTVDRTGESGTFTTANVTVASTTSPLSTSSSRSFQLNLTQTGPNTEIFTRTLNLAAATNTATNTIGVTAGDILSITNNDDESTSVLIIPNSNATVGSIKAAAGDTITATSFATTSTATISSGAGSGGGGGGVVRPTVIVNVVAGVSTLLGGSSSSTSAPLIGTASLISIVDPAQGLAGTVATDLNSLSSTKTAKTGEKLSFQLDINNNAGIDYLTHVEFGVNNKGLANVASDTSIIYDKFKSPQITIIDPHKLFANTKFDIIQKDPRNGMLKFEVTFAKPMDTSDVRLLAWDINRNFVQKYYEDAIKIESSEKTSLVETKTQDKIDTNQIQQKIKPQKVIQKENQKDILDKKTQKTEFDKLTKNTVDKKKTKDALVKKLQDKTVKTADKQKDSPVKKLQDKTVKTADKQKDSPVKKLQDKTIKTNVNTK